MPHNLKKPFYSSIGINILLFLAVIFPYVFYSKYSGKFFFQVYPLLSKYISFSAIALIILNLIIASIINKYYYKKWEKENAEFEKLPFYTTDQIKVIYEDYEYCVDCTLENRKVTARIDEDEVEYSKEYARPVVQYKIFQNNAFITKLIMDKKINYKS